MDVKACARLTRPVNSVMVGFAVVVGVFIAAGVEKVTIEPLSVLAGFAAGTLIAAAAMVLNDIVDIDIDRVNEPGRPLPSGRVTIRQAYACFAALSIAGLLAAAWTGVPTLAVAAAAWLLAVVYDTWGKRSGLPGNLMVAAATSIPFVYAMALLRCMCGEMLVFWAIVFLTVLAREVAKDIADVEGDRLGGARTLPILVGEAKAARVAALLYIAAVALSPLPLLEGKINPLTYTPLVAIVDAILVYESARIMRTQDRETILEHKRNVLIAMLIGLLAFLAGSVA